YKALARCISLARALWLILSLSHSVSCGDVDANLEKQYWAFSHPLELYQLGDYYNLRLRVNNAIASPIIPLVNNHKLRKL
ncbi:TPA: hypothetical protein ACGO12_002252, partial [Streptococcus suis]